MRARSLARDDDVHSVQGRSVSRSLFCPHTLSGPVLRRTSSEPVSAPSHAQPQQTQEPSRRNIHVATQGAVEQDVTASTYLAVTLSPAMESLAAAQPSNADAPAPSQPVEQHFTIHYGDTGYSYESIVLPYLAGAKHVEIEDPYIRATHQLHSFVRFCETVIKAPRVRKITLTASYDGSTDLKELAARLDELKQSLLELDVALEVKVNENLHDREVRIDNGGVIKIGRGLDFFQKPDSWFGIGQTISACATAWKHQGRHLQELNAACPCRSEGDGTSTACVSATSLTRAEQQKQKLLQLEQRSVSQPRAVPDSHSLEARCCFDVCLVPCETRSLQPSIVP